MLFSHQNSGQRGMTLLCILSVTVIVLCFSHTANAVTDYIFFEVNGDTTAPALVQGDTLSFGANCDLESTVTIEIWYDINGNSNIDPESDLILDYSNSTDGVFWSDFNPIADGWVVSPPMVLSLPTGNYIFKALNISDSTTVQRTIMNSEMSSPPNIVRGQITVPGHPAPDPILQNVMISTETESEEEGVFLGITDINGDYEINIQGSIMGQYMWLGPKDIPSYVASYGEVITVSGTVEDIDFTYQPAVDSIYGTLKDDQGNIVYSYDWVGCSIPESDEGEKGSRLKNSTYAFYFSAEDKGEWELELDAEGTLTEYLKPYRLLFSHDTLTSFQHDLILIRPDTAIFIRVTENGGLPANPYLFEIDSYNLQYWTETISGTGSNNISRVPVSSQDMTGWTVMLRMDSETFPISSGLILVNNTMTNIAPGDTVDIDFIDGKLVSGTITQDPEDAPISWSDLWIGLHDGVRSFNGEVENDGTFNVYSDTGNLWLIPGAEDYLFNPAWHYVPVTGDTTVGLDFIANRQHCGIYGTIEGIPTMPDGNYEVSAQTDADGFSGYWMSRDIDNESKLFELWLCEGDWTINAPYIDGYISPDPQYITVGESPDTLHSITLVYTIPYECGNVNADGAVNIGDIVFLVNYIFKAGPAPDPLCLGRTNFDSPVNIGDVTYLVNYVFKSGPAPNPDCCD